MTWASKRNKREVSIFISFEVIIISISSNLTSKSLFFFKIKHLYHMYFNFDLAYKTIAVYENALRLPLLFGLGMNLDCPLVTHYMLVYMLLNYLLGACLIFCFCSLMNSFHSRLVVFFRLSQKTLALILLASGRRIHEISSLSTEFRRSGDEVVLYWPEGSKAKCYRVGHYPEDPSIRKRSHFWRT